MFVAKFEVVKSLSVDKGLEVERGRQRVAHILTIESRSRIRFASRPSLGAAALVEISLAERS